jgi:acyl dehydratase
MSNVLPRNGVAVLASAIFTVGRKARPLKEEFEHLYECEPINEAHLEQYKKFVGFTNDPGIPLSYVYLFAQRAQLSMMMDSRFTYPVPGLVHMANSMQSIGLVDATLPMDLKITATQEPVTQTGRLCILFKVTIEQLGMPKVSCTSRYLGKRGNKKDAAKDNFEPQSNLEPLADWAVPQDTGRRYAALSGDYNPIHLWPWSARLFGFKKPIAHGMYSVAKAQALIETSLGKPVTSLDATFVMPASLPSHTQLSVGTKDFRLMSNEQILIIGHFDLG